MSTSHRLSAFSLVWPLIIITIVAIVGYHYRHTIAGWFKQTDDGTQTIVLRQTSSPSPKIDASVAAPGSITQVTPTPVIPATSPTATPVPGNESLPTAGPLDDIEVAAGVGLIIAGYIARKYYRPSAPVSSRPFIL